MLGVTPQNPPMGGWTPEAGTFRNFFYVKTKESGSLGGRVPGTPPRSANGRSSWSFISYKRPV